MTRLSVLAIATLLSSSALGEEIFLSEKYKTIASKTTDPSVAAIVTSRVPLTLVPLVPAATTLSLNSLPPGQPPGKTILRDEPGGRIDMHRMRFAALNASGNDIEIRGMCYSACTLVMGIIPANRICFSAQGFLSFHKASNADGTVSLEHTIGMVASYPTGIQKWIAEQGGVDAMPHKGRWVLAAPDLWKMGYRRCD